MESLSHNKSGSTMMVSNEPAERAARECPPRSGISSTILLQSDAEGLQNEALRSGGAVPAEKLEALRRLSDFGGHLR